MDARSGLESEETVPLIGELARNQVVPVLPVFSGTIKGPARYSLNGSHSSQKSGYPQQ